MKVDVILASHTQYVPQVGLPHIEPDTKTIAVYTSPIVIAEFKKIAAIFVRQTRKINPFTARKI
jgi:hypothetical protein